MHPSSTTKKLRKTGMLVILFLLVVQSLVPVVAAGNGVSTSSSSGVGTTDTITNGFSSVSNIGNGYDPSTSSHSKLIADGDFSGNFGSFCSSQTTTAFAQVLYTLDLQSSSNQSITVSLYSETEFSFGPGWSTVSGLEMSAQITDNGGTWTAWTSTTTNNSAGPTSGDIILGDVTPRSNGTIDVLMRIQHDGVTTSSCHAELWVYDFFSDAQLAPSISYAGTPFTFTKNVDIGTNSPSNTGGASSSWAITSGSLPSGLSFSSTTGAITGTPNAVFSTASITIEATNSGGSDSTTISITVQEEVPSISYAGSPFTFTKNVGIGTNSPTNTGGASTSWSITSGSLPSGLSLSPTSGAITGTPNAVFSTASITIEATNSGGSDSTTISITVDDQAPAISYAGSPFSFTKNSAISGASPSNTGGASSSWAITSGSLPSGLSLSSTTGAITGTPNAVSAPLQSLLKQPILVAVIPPPFRLPFKMRHQ